MVVLERWAVSYERGTPVAGIQISSTGAKVDVRLPGKGNSNSQDARPVHLIITMIKWIRTSRLSITKSLSPLGPRRAVWWGNSGAYLEPMDRCVSTFDREGPGFSNKTLNIDL